MGKIFYIMGKSSSGKDTIYKRLLETFPQFRTVVLYTTRPIRDGERDGVEYFFVDHDRMREMQEEERVIEMRSYDTKCGIWSYFTADDGQINLDKYDYLMIGTLESCLAMREYFGEERIVPIYIEVEDGVRLQRAVERERRQSTPMYAELCRRFLADTDDFSETNLKKTGIRKRFENIDLEQCLRETEEYIRENTDIL